MPRSARVIERKDRQRLARGQNRPGLGFGLSDHWLRAACGLRYLDDATENDFQI